MLDSRAKKEVSSVLVSSSDGAELSSYSVAELVSSTSSYPDPSSPEPYSGPLGTAGWIVGLEM